METLLEQLKAAFKESRFDEARRLIVEIRKTEPENPLASHIEKKISDLEAEAHRKAHQEEIETLENKIKTAFKEGHFDVLRSAAEAIKKLEAQNSVAAKFLKKAEDEEKAAKEKAVKEEARQKEDQEKAAKKQAEAALKAQAAAKKAEQKALEQKAKEEAKMAEKAAKLKVVEEQEKKEVEQEALRLKEKAEVAVAKEATKKQAEASKIPWSARWVKIHEKTKAFFKKDTVGAQNVVPSPVATTVASAVEATQGNIFTKLFQKKSEESKEESIIDTIVAQTDQKPAHEEPTDPGERMMSLARLTLQLSAVFVLVTAAFLYTQVVDRQNTVMGLMGIESNVASRLHGASEKLAGDQEKEKEIQKEISLYKKGYNNQYEKTIQKVVGNRIDWTDVMNKVGEVADSVYEHNALSQYIKFTGYSFNADKKQVVVNGTLSDPLGQNLTKLIELEGAFKSYPKDPNNPDDKTAPYFYNVEATDSIGKSFDQQSNKYLSSFRFSFYLEKQVEAKKKAAKTKKN